MKASTAYIAGLGTTGVLIASFVLTLVVVSAIVALAAAGLTSPRFLRLRPWVVPQTASATP